MGDDKLKEVVKVRLKNTGKFLNTDEEGAAAIAEEENAVSENVDKTLEAVEKNNNELQALQAENEKLKGELEAYKGRLEEALNPENVANAAEAMIEESDQSEQILENMCSESDEKKKAEIKNSLKGIHGLEKKKAVLQNCGIDITTMSDGEVSGAFSAYHNISKSVQRPAKVSGTKITNKTIPHSTDGHNIVTRTSHQRLGFK